MNFAQMLLAKPPDPLFDPEELKPRSRNIDKYTKRKSEESIAKYKEALGTNTMTTSEIAQSVNVSRKSAYEMLAKLTQSGVVEMLGTKRMKNGSAPRMWRLKCS